MEAKRIVARFYRTRAGSQPVRDWLLSIEADDRRIVGGDIARVEYGWPIGMPACRGLGDGLYEVRSTVRSGKVEARTYFGIDGTIMLLLNSHEGKSRQDHEIAIARQRWSDYMQRKGARSG